MKTRVFSILIMLAMQSGGCLSDIQNGRVGVLADATGGEQQQYPEEDAAKNPPQACQTDTDCVWLADAEKACLDDTIIRTEPICSAGLCTLQQTIVRTCEFGCLSDGTCSECKQDSDCPYTIAYCSPENWTSSHDNPQCVGGQCMSDGKITTSICERPCTDDNLECIFCEASINEGAKCTFVPEPGWKYPWGVCKEGTCIDPEPAELTIEFLGDIYWTVPAEPKVTVLTFTLKAVDGPILVERLLFYIVSWTEVPPGIEETTLLNETTWIGLYDTETQELLTSSDTDSCWTFPSKDEDLLFWRYDGNDCEKSYVLDNDGIMVGRNSTRDISLVIDTSAMQDASSVSPNFVRVFVPEDKSFPDYAPSVRWRDLDAGGKIHDSTTVHGLPIQGPILTFE